MDELAFNSATELASLIKAGEVSSLELLEMYLARIEKYNPDLNAIVVLDEERARKQATAADAALASGEATGSLHGVPMTIKESYDVAGLPTTFGYEAFKDNIATQDALSVQRLKAAGAIIFGKTNVPVALADFQSYNDVYGTTNNPWRFDRIPGGSSGGSAAALAAGLTGFESGSDIGGSIRNPAHFCGVFGHKPTYDLLPPRGHNLNGDVAASALSVIGPLGRSAHDLRLGVEAMAGPDEIMSAGFRLNLKPLNKSLSELNVAVWSNDELAPVTREIEERVNLVAERIQEAGGRVDAQARPNFDSTEAHKTYQSLLQATMASRMPDDNYNRLAVATTALDKNDQSDRAQTLRAQMSNVRTYNQADEARAKCRWSWHEFFQTYDIILMPVSAVPAFAHDHSPPGSRTLMVDDQERPYFEQVFWAGMAIMSHLPATVIPTGPGKEGLPIGVQIVGAEYSDLFTIGVAELLEDAGFSFQPPPNYSKAKSPAL